MKQFKLKPGDIVNPILRPAGILVPEGSGVGRFQAAFGQIAAQVGADALAVGLGHHPGAGAALALEPLELRVEQLVHPRLCAGQRRLAQRQLLAVLTEERLEHGMDQGAAVACRHSCGFVGLLDRLDAGERIL